MRLTNYRATKLIPSVYFFCIAIAALLVFLFQIMGTQFLPSVNYLVAIEVGIALFLIYTFVNGKYIEYDSEGALVSFYTRGVILSELFNYRDKRFNLKRESIYDFKILNLFFYKQVSIYYTSSKTKQKHKFKLNITLLSPRKIRYMRISLAKLVKQNLT